MKTEVGHSGSPILMRRREGEMVVVGIHTHRGVRKGVNLGVCFTANNMQIINRYKRELLEQIDNLSRFSMDRVTTDE
jgi:V8-like Glu-specific endopeptidase